MFIISLKFIKDYSDKLVKSLRYWSYMYVRVDDIILRFGVIYFEVEVVIKFFGM